MSKYLYKPMDIGIFLNNADLPHSYENKILENLWITRNIELELKYRKNKMLFYKSVSREMGKYILDTNNHEVDSINKILEDIGSNFTINTSGTEDYIVEAFFKVNKLKRKRQIYSVFFTPPVPDSIDQYTMSTGGFCIGFKNYGTSA